MRPVPSSLRFVAVAASKGGNRHKATHGYTQCRLPTSQPRECAPF
jgi:hypothetical protein